MLKFLHVVGARPNFMKIAPLMDALHQVAAQRKADLEQVLVHTGQHYSREMSSLLFEQLGLPEPTINLEVGSGGHGMQTGRIMEAFERVLLEQKPDLVIVVGDVNSTIACALDAKKHHIPVAHVEAGLRSFDREMPEELNRVLTDAISDYLFTTEPVAEENLAREGVAREKIHFVGNTMIDTLLHHRENALTRDVLDQLNLRDTPYAVVTLHRPSNVDNPQILEGILVALEQISRDLKIVFPVHPRTYNQIESNGFSALLEKGNFHLIDPQGYLDFLCLVANARLVLSDSGGIQEETTVLGVPCLTLRHNTERPITIENGTNRLVGNVGTDIMAGYHEVQSREWAGRRVPEKWDGKAAGRIAAILLDSFIN